MRLKEEEEEEKRVARSRGEEGKQREKGNMGMTMDNYVVSGIGSQISLEAGQTS